MGVARHLLITNDYLPKTGGIQVYLHELWRRLERGQAVVLTATSDSGAREFDRHSDVVIERIPQKTLFLPTRKVRKFIETAIATHDPDFVLFDPAWPLGLIGPRLSRPYGVILHGAEVAIPGRLPFVSSTLKYVLRNAVVAVCAGSYPEAEARRNAGALMPPVVQVPPGVDIARFIPLSPSERQSVRQEMGISDTALIVASYSRLVPRKGMDILIKASATLKEEFPDLTVMIGGTGRDGQRLRKLARRLHAPVTFLGRVSDEQLPKWLGSSDLFVMDCRSRWFRLEQEGFGMVFGEAGAAGIPQIAGRSGGSHEVVRHGETGLVVDEPKSVSALVVAMRELLADPRRRALMATQSRRVAEDVYNWDKLARGLAAGLKPFAGAEE